MGVWSGAADGITRPTWDTAASIPSTIRSIRPTGSRLGTTHGPVPTGGALQCTARTAAWERARGTTRGPARILAAQSRGVRMARAELAKRTTRVQERMHAPTRAVV